MPKIKAPKIRKATKKEVAAWKIYKEMSKISSIDYPILLQAYGHIILGTLHIKDDYPDSWCEGTVAGPLINGSFRLDRFHLDADLYDPTKALLMLNIHMHFQARELNCRFDTRQDSGRWSQGDTIVIIRW